MRRGAAPATVYGRSCLESMGPATFYASAQPDAPSGRALSVREYALPKPFMPEALVALVRQIIS